LTHPAGVDAASGSGDLLEELLAAADPRPEVHALFRKARLRRQRVSGGTREWTAVLAAWRAAQ